MLELEDVIVKYGPHLALSSASISIDKGETVVVLGANGAGKSTLLKSIAGMVGCEPGSRVTLNGKSIVDLPADKVAEAGIALVPEGRGIFGAMTVQDNLRLGGNLKRSRSGETEREREIVELFPRLGERRNQIARTMSGGEQQMLAIGRALMSDPDFLLLDEPSLGLAPVVVASLFAVLEQIQAKGVGLLIVEQNVRMSLRIADRGYLMEAGRIVGEGTAQELENDIEVRRTFLGATTNEGRKDPMKTLELLIEGRDVASSTGKTFVRNNPMTGDVATTAAAASVDDAVAAADAAAKAFPEWSSVGPSERRAVLWAASDALAARSDDIVDAMVSEIGATPGWAMFNVQLAANMLREASALTTMVKGELIPADRPGSYALGIREPAGVVLSIAPWNAPIILGIRSIAAPLACGNTVVMKTSELCPRTHRVMIEAVQSAGLAPGVLNAISNAPEDASDVVQALAGHNAVRRINFTGSTRVGKIIAEIAARHLKPALLELGGKAPMLVLDDADIDAAVAAAVFGAYMNQGQICMSTERLIVDESVADEFVEKLGARVRDLKVGDPREGKAPLGCVVNREAATRIEGLIRDAIDKGATLVAGGGSDSVQVEATLLDEVAPTMRIYSEESFGPTASVVRVGGVDEAVRIANDTDYGLSSSVFSKDVTRALAVARRVESGICHINGPTVHDEAQMPFGGVKASGYGRFGGTAAIAEFTDLRWVTIQEGTPHYPF